MAQQTDSGAKKNTRMALGRGLSALVSSPPSPKPHEQQTSPTPPSNVDSVVPQYHQSPSSLATNSSNETVSKDARTTTLLPISQIERNPEQPRQEFSDTEISELSDSIKALGVIQPIIVRARGDKFEIIAGERRFRAATRAGLQEVPVLIREISEQEAFEIAMVENIQRQQLNPIEEAKGYQRLVDEFSLTIQEVAERVGKDRATISNFMRLLRLPDEVQDLVRSGKISMGHAKAILTVKEPSAQIGLANKIISEHLSVRAIEAIVAREVVLDTRTKNTTSESPKTKGSGPIPAYPELEERLRNTLGTKVTVQKKRKGGQVELHFFSDEELDRLVQILLTNRGND